MKITLHKSADFEKINQEWAAINAPVFLKRTKDPKVFTTKLKKGCEPIVAELFLITQMGISDDEKNKAIFNGLIMSITNNERTVNEP